ncbi:MAG: ATP-dependent DNA helicase RecG [Alphaproteobacteria bacterium]|jgi:ATP-dependent DNA helicase RecG|nr:ATP-dependent DNA helicase RecG [Alphaproteobacteria bacterium]
MRPPALNPLFAEITALPGVGPRIAPLLAKAAGPKVVDLLWHLPTGLIDRRQTPSVADAPVGEVATLRLRVEGHIPQPRTHRTPYRVRCRDDSGTIDLVYFHPNPDWLAKTLPVGEEWVVSGRVDLYQGQRQMPHPDLIEPPERFEAVAVVEPVYRLSTGLVPKVMSKTVAAALERLPELPEWQDPAWLARQGWPAWHEALHAAHRPQGQAELAPDTPPRRRLAYDELLSNQLALALIRAAYRRRPGRPFAGDGRLRDRLAAALPFALTPSQTMALAEITGDMASDYRMLRLLQGDVGSGKTVVALFAMLAAVECGAQAALLAPTEVLARQHFETILPLAAKAGVPAALLTGRDKGRPRAETVAELAAGMTRIIVGTHALLSEDVGFADLGLAVIDEQHRFGVDQRLALSAKGRAVDMLVMTATPIPRTLQLTAYGDMDVSRITEKPPGRRPVDTRTIPQERLAEIVEGIGRQIDRGAQVFWVCPLVEESESSDLAAAEERAAALQRRFGERVGLIHGRLKSAEKDRVMAGFAAGDIALLVATTVIEVGVNVPAATVMVIEHAERFGLAQLHQLRGRVGRSDRPSTCILLYAPPLTDAAKARLKVLRDTEDGFLIAEEDLRLRGPGEVLGVRQSGLPGFRLADPAAHGDLLNVAGDDCRLILQRDPDLQSPRGEALRTLLYLFERDAAVRYLRSG